MTTWYRELPFFDPPSVPLLPALNLQIAVSDFFVVFVALIRHLGQTNDRNRERSAACSIDPKRGQLLRSDKRKTAGYPRGAARATADRRGNSAEESTTASNKQQQQQHRGTSQPQDHITDHLRNTSR